MITYEVALTIIAYVGGALTDAPSTHFARVIYEQGSCAACRGLLASNTIPTEKISWNSNGKSFLFRNQQVI
ncbi:MAG TPA: hypothetical protein VJ695_04230 [Nitrososphaera sp.]|nr:hypothetical protein [Nitrososphaera sp.]